MSILDGLLPNYETVDVLQSPELRDGIKEFSQWPTIPQLYVGGQFVGGCDIVREMSASGELGKLLGVEIAATAPPSITLSAAAAKAIGAAAPQADGEPLHLLRTACRIIIVSGRGAYEAPAESEKLAAVLTAKAVPHVLDLWGPDVNHDWPWWRRMLPHHLPSIL